MIGEYDAPQRSFFSGEEHTLVSDAPISPNWGDLIPRAQSRDFLASQDLFIGLMPELNRYFKSRVPVMTSEDLASDTFLAIYSNLEQFDPNVGNDNIEQQFKKWSFTIARNKLLDHVREESRVEFGYVERNPQLLEIPQIADEEQELEPEPEDLLPRFKERLAEILRPVPLMFIEMRMGGKSNAQIADEFGISEQAANSKIFRARQKVEELLILPTGLRRVGEYHDHSLSVAAFRGNLRAAYFIGLWYTRDEWVKIFMDRRPKVDENLLANGYLLLAECTSEDEYTSLKHEINKNRVLRKGGRIYIHTDQLTEYRALRKPKARSKV